jgi:hypothetical protein
MSPLLLLCWWPNCNVGFHLRCAVALPTTWGLHWAVTREDVVAAAVAVPSLLH